MKFGISSWLDPKATCDHRQKSSRPLSTESRDTGDRFVLMVLNIYFGMLIQSISINYLLHLVEKRVGLIRPSRERTAVAGASGFSVCTDSLTTKVFNLLLLLCNTRVRS